MAPRRRSETGAAVPEPPSLASLPDDLLLRCLELLSQEERFGSVALVSKRFQQLCLAPQLLRRLDVRIHAGASVLPRSAALLQFLAAHAAHVQELELDVDPEAYGNDEDAAQLADSQQQELAANAAGALVACATAGQLQRLTIGALTPLISLAWLPALQQLQSLELGSAARTLRLPAAMSRLTALADASLWGSPLVLEGPLPPGLTQLQICDATSTELPRQVSQLSALAMLQLVCEYQAASMACLSTLTTVRRLDVINAPALHPTLPAMTWLECLNLEVDSASAAEEQAAWRQTEAAALHQLTRLTTLALSAGSELESTLTAIAQLPRLQRLSLGSSSSAALPSPAALDGPWLASLRWLGLPLWLLEQAVQALRAAPRLEYVCSLDMPARTDEEPWLAAWDFLATHPPLRCFGVDEADGDIPSLPLLNALFRLHNRRLALQLSRPGDPSSSFSNFSFEVLESKRIPPPIL